MGDEPVDCVLCRAPETDGELQRVGVWEDDLWRLSASLAAEVPGFCYLEPKRHIRHITDLDGEEAATLGAVLAGITTVLRDVTAAEVVYVYVFGSGVPHLHLHLAPHRPGDALSSSIIRGEGVTTSRRDGTELIESAEFPVLPEAELRRIAAEVSRRLRADNT